MPDFIGQDTKILQKKLNALELLIRKYTNNNFQNRSIRFIGNSLGDRIFGGHPFIRVGDTIQISESEVNDGLYVVTEVGKDFIRLDKEVFTVDSNMVTKVVYPEDIQVGIINLLKYEVDMRDKVGIKSESLSRHSVFDEKQQHNELWEFYIHKLPPWDERTFEQFKHDLKVGNKPKGERPTKEQLEATIKDSYKIMQNFEIEKEGG